MCVCCRKKAKTNPAQNKSRPGYRSGSKGSLKVVGIGPGDLRQMSQRAREAITECQVIVGYKTYLRLLGSLAADKEIVSSEMTEEIKRAKTAIKKAQEGKRVCVVSSGDPGVYGMAGLILELLNPDQLDAIEVEIVPGIPAASSCASLLGAPLMHDFVTISLSDRLTDKELIAKRVKLATQGDFVLVFYNPRSRNRIAPLKKAWQLLMKRRPPHTPVGIVKNAYRERQEVIITEVGKMFELIDKINMGTTVIVGNTKTYVKGKYLVTPRGYHL